MPKFVWIHNDAEEKYILESELDSYLASGYSRGRSQNDKEKLKEARKNITFTKVCPLCGDKFLTSSPKQKYCKKPVKKICIVCNSVYFDKCEPSTRCTCDNPECRKKAGGCARPDSTITRICEVCRDEFHPDRYSQRYCNKMKTTHCVICGKEILYVCNLQNSLTTHTCDNPGCIEAYRHQQSEESCKKKTRICTWCGKQFHPVHPSQIYCDAKHYKKCEVCGKEFEVTLGIGSISELPRTCSDECLHIWQSKVQKSLNHEAIAKKISDTYFKKTGYKHPMHNPKVIAKIGLINKEKYGYEFPIQDQAMRSKIMKSAQKSNLEKRIADLLNNYHINFEEQYRVTVNEKSHVWDFYLPDYKFLIDADGVYYHAYLDDPNGHHVIDYFDEMRPMYVPEGYRFHIVVEGQEDKDIKHLAEMLQNDFNFDLYDSEIFKWCRSINFPYPEYSDERMKRMWNKLCNHNIDHYTPNSRLGDCIVQNFHKSIYHAHVGNYVSPYEAWYNDELLKKVIKNRLIYVNNVDPSKVLKGFNISKICPRVSIFNPVLARFLTQQYLSEFDEVFDPFSGYSGRLLGVSSCDKKYIGQDLNGIAVKESNEIIQFLDLQNAAVNVQDIFNSTGQYQCLLTCPPYGKKETYSSETKFLSCDDWINEILNRFDCKRYVFVVDTTERFKDDVAIELRVSSHYVNLTEKVIVINK